MTTADRLCVLESKPSASLLFDTNFSFASNIMVNFTVTENLCLDEECKAKTNYAL